MRVAVRVRIPSLLHKGVLLVVRHERCTDFCSRWAPLRVLPRAASPLQNTAAVAVAGYQLRGYYSIANLPFRPLRIVNAGANNHVGVCDGVWSRVEPVFEQANALVRYTDASQFLFGIFLFGKCCTRSMQTCASAQRACHVKQG